MTVAATGIDLNEAVMGLILSYLILSNNKYIEGLKKGERQGV